MWKKTLGLAVLAVGMIFSLEGCQSYHRGYAYREGYAPGYVSVRVVRPPRRVVVVPGPRYGPVYHYDAHDGHHHHKSKDRH